jgi:flagellar secretion chaperone FliS
MFVRAANAYRRVDLESAPKTQIVERLFARCVADLGRARAAIGANDIRTKASELDHALQIVVELKASLDFSAAPALCTNLAALYDFVVDRIATANLTLKVLPLDQATRIMTELGDAFRETHGK